GEAVTRDFYRLFRVPGRMRPVYRAGRENHGVESTVEDRTMRRTLVLTLAVPLWAVHAVNAQSWQPPSDGERCPSKWGPDDQRGSANLMKPQAVLRASRLIRTGEVIELGHVLTGSMPLSAGRRFEVITKRTNMNPESNHRGSNEELVIAEIGQVGT